MLLIYCKVVLKLKWTNHCLFSGAIADNDNANSNDIIFIIKDTKLYNPVVTLLAKDNQKVSKLFSKGFERSVSSNNNKTKSENRKTTTNLLVLKPNVVGVNRLFVLNY